MNRTAAANGPAAQAVETQAEAGLLDRVIEATQAYRMGFEEMKYTAEATAKSGLFGLTAAQAFVLMKLAEADGIPAIQAVRRYDVIDGKPSMKAATMQAEFTRHGGRIRIVQRTKEVCSAEFSHPKLQPEPLLVSWTLKELIENGTAVANDGKLKKNYNRTPRAMLHARVISEGVRAVDPGIVVGLYTPEEVSDFDDRPSPRPFPADAPASYQELVAATPEPTAPQPTPSSDCGRWIQTRVDQANAEWSMMCVQAKKPYKKLCNRFQCVNGIVTSWLESNPPRLYPEAVEIDGKRDNAKVADVLKEMWESEERDIVKFDVNSYLDLKLEEATKAAGINMDAQPPEEALSNA